MLITTRLGFLQQMQKAAISGYHFYTVGCLDITKLPSLIKKFEKRYIINQSRQQAYRQRQKGQASAKFYCYADETDPLGQKIFWVLLFTKGKTTAHQEEQLQNLTLKKTRFVYSDYQLIQKPRKDGKQTFTFQLKTESLAYYQNRLRKSIRNQNVFEINKLMQHLNVMPGFSALRKQKTQLKKLIKGEMNRHLSKEQHPNIIKMTNFYHRQQKQESVVRLKVFMQQMLQNERTIKQQLKTYRNNKQKRGTKRSKSQESEQKEKGLISKLLNF